MPTRPDSEVSSQGRRRFLTTTAISIAAASAANAMVSAVSGARAISAQDKYTVRLPNGLAFSEFRGFEDWPTVAVSQAGDLIEVIVRQSPDGQGLPGRRSRQWQDLPGRSKMAKIHWKSKKSAEAPDPTTVPDTLHDIDFMVRDSKRFSNTGNWGYAQFNYDTASDTFKPEGTGADCRYACHTIVAKKDYVFTAYGKR